MTDSLLAARERKEFRFRVRAQAVMARVGHSAALPDPEPCGVNPEIENPQ